MGTWGELTTLVRTAAALWWRFLPQLLLWFWVGYAVQRLCLQTASGFGADAQLTANVFVGMDLVATAGATIFMIHALGPGLTHFRSRLRRFRATPPHSAGESAADPPIPTDVAAWRSGLDTLAVTIGPFLAIYSVWGMVADEIRDLLVVSAKNHGTSDVSSYPVDLSNTAFFLWLALGAGLLRIGVLALLRLSRRRSRQDGHRGPGFGLTFLGVYLEGMWVYLVFVVAGLLVADVLGWLGDRVVTVWLHEQWVRVTDLLPDLFGFPLPAAIRTAASWVATTLVPAAGTSVLLPLLWLALTATVFGWRDLRLRDLAALPFLRGTTSRLGPDGPLALLGRLVKAATGDLRTKYLPVATSLRMLLRAGPRLLGAYLVLATAVAVLSRCTEALARVAIGPVGVERWAQTEPFLGLAIGTLFTPVLIALYAATFDRCLAVVPADSVPLREARLR